ncbi:hypothetical protein B0A50_08297 [Salinomyces thailandicus]|uniref:Cytochrome b561 domain-containing protein n=1 Tax=Salinomyces thailandicus TaxID=706561 RepID=A0A4U0TL05_9PEZI|nr:hypothetical protein B0A50_08297 [Salinomyces thailandica]
MLNTLARQYLLLVVSLCALSRHVVAQSSAPDPMGASIPSAVFVDNSTDSGAFTFAINIDEETEDVYFHLSYPAVTEWMAVGFGEKMQGALMLIAYPSSNGTGMTLSPRLGIGNTEPEHTKDIKCELIWEDELVKANIVANGVGANKNTKMMTVDAVCRDATTWKTGKLNYDYSNDASDDAPSYSKTTTPFIYALGPSLHGGPGGHHTGLQSNSPAAGLERHSYYGHFTLDLSQATANTSSAGIPRGNNPYDNRLYVSEYAANAATGPGKTDHYPAPYIHGVIMCLCFVIIFPLGALLLRLLPRVLPHTILQTIGFILVTMATAGGIVISRLYVRSKNFTSGHQVLGILIFIALIFQLGLGILHHRSFKKHKQGTLMGKVHLFLGPLAILLGIINAPIGFVLAGNSHLGIPYAIAVIIIALLFLFARIFLRRYLVRIRRAKGQQQQHGPVGSYPHAAHFGQGTGGGVSGYTGPQAANYDHLGSPPAYDRSTSFGSEDVPLRVYGRKGSEGGPGAPQFPRPVV